MSRAGDQLDALLLPSCKATDSTVDKVIATAMPIGRSGMCMIQRRLAEVKIRRRARWWFSTSQNGGFRPEADRKRPGKNLTTETRRHGESQNFLPLINTDNTDRKKAKPLLGFQFRRFLAIM